MNQIHSRPDKVLKGDKGVLFTAGWEGRNMFCGAARTCGATDWLAAARDW